MDPSYATPEYASTSLRAPTRPLLALPAGPTERSGPRFGAGGLGPADADLTRQHSGEPLGERITVSGRVVDGAGHPVGGQLLEVWQANASGRYAHDADRHPAALDPNFTGNGRCLTDAGGRWRFVTVRPGAYPWRNHPNAWRPAHLHFSVFGRAFTERLVTQMYFPGDPLLAYDPIFNSVRDPSARLRMICSLDWSTTQAEWALGYHFDIVVAGHLATPSEGP